MRKLTKKLAASVLSLALVVAMGTTCFAATWGSYFGAADGWYEGADGTLTTQSATGWTAQLNTVGWGGIWGAQVCQDAAKGTGSISITKGQSYTLSFTMKSSNCDKWVYIKIASGETLAFSDWVQLKKGVNTTYSKTFTAAANADSIYFGLGGDFGDRVGVSSDVDAEARYAVFGSDYATVLSGDANGDPNSATIITLSKFSLGASAPAKPTIKSVKNNKSKKVKVTLKKKIAGAAGYQIQISTTKKFKKVLVKKNVKKITATITSKKLKVGTKYYVRVRAYNTGKKAYSDWSKVKKVTIKK